MMDDSTTRTGGHPADGEIQYRPEVELRHFRMLIEGIAELTGAQDADARAAARAKLVACRRGLRDRQEPT